VLSKLAEKGRNLPTSLIVPVPVSDEMDPKALMGKLEEMKGMFGDLIEMVGEAMGEAGEAAKEAEDMAGMKTKYADMEAAVAAKEKEVEDMKAEMAEMSKASDSLAVQRDSLLAEVEPLRAKELDELRVAAKGFGCDETKVAACKDAAELRRIVAVTKLGERYNETVGDGEAKTYRVNDDMVSGVYVGLVASLGSTETAAQTRDYAGPFARFPAITPAPPDKPKTKTRDASDSADETDAFTAGLKAMGG
jgi:hypothetical protein